MKDPTIPPSDKRKKFMFYDTDLKYLENCKEKYQIQGQQKRNKIGSINKQKKQTEKKFALQNDEIEDIFDMIEMETDI